MGPSGRTFDAGGLLRSVPGDPCVAADSCHKFAPRCLFKKKIRTRTLQLAQTTAVACAASLLFGAGAGMPYALRSWCGGGPFRGAPDAAVRAMCSRCTRMRCTRVLLSLCRTMQSTPQDRGSLSPGKFKASMAASRLVSASSYNARRSSAAEEGGRTVSASRTPSRRSAWENFP